MGISKFLRLLVSLTLLLSLLSFGAVTFKDGKVIFTFKTDIKANVVYLAGNFNNWSPNAWAMKLVDGVWTYEVELKPGSYQYKYVIDGKTWKEDPEAPSFVDDGFGGKNGAFTLTEDGKILGGESREQASGKKYELNAKRENTIFVDADGYVVIRFYNKEAKYVFIAGSFNNWKDNDTECYYIENGWWEAVLELQPGIYEYKFVADGKWFVDPNAFAYVDDGFGGKNGVFEVAKEGGKLVVRAPLNAGKVSEEKKTEVTTQAQQTTVTTGKVKAGLSIEGKNVVFAVKKENAQEAYLAGSFNNWNPKTLKMQLIEGYWVASLPLQPGAYRYKFVFVIGGSDVWEEDPNAPSYEPDGYGGKNGVFKLIEKDGALSIEGVEQQAGGLPVKGKYEFSYSFKTDSSKYLVSSGFTNSLTLKFEPTKDFSLSLKYDGASISKALVNFVQENYAIGMHYKLPWDFVSDTSLYGYGTGIVGKLKLFDNWFIVGGLAYESNSLPWILGIDGGMLKFYVSNQYFTDDLEFTGEFNLAGAFDLSICGMYSLDNSLFASLNFSTEQFGLYISLSDLVLSTEILTALGQDTITLGGIYDMVYGDAEIYIIYSTSQIEYYFKTDLSNLKFEITTFGKDRDLGFGVDIDLSDPIGNTTFTIFGNVRF